MSQNSVIEDKLHNEVKVQKYLDLQGLKVFLQYMTARISAMNGTTIPYNGDENSKSISTKIDELWNMVAGGSGTDIQGSLSENVAAILGEYVKRIVENDGVVPEDGYVGVKVDHGYYDDGGNWVDGNLQGKGIYTITINETKLVQKLADLTNNRVTKLVVDKKGNIVVDVDYETGDIHLTIDSTAIDNAIDAIKNYTVNGKTISTNPILSAGDVNLGVDINSEYTAGKSIHESIKNIINTIAGLGYVVELKGVLDKKPSSTAGYENGDVIIVGNSEYVCWESKWYLFGNTSELLSHYNTHTHSYTPAGTVSASFSGQSNNATCSDANQEGYYASVSQLKNGGSLPSYSSIDVSNKDHTHSVTYTPTGSVTASFEGKGGSFTTDTLTTGGTVKVQSLKNVGTLPSYSSIDVSNKDHTHSVIYTPTGSVTASFEGKGGSFTTDTLTTGGTVKVQSLKNVGTLPSYSGISVPNTLHTHTVTHTPAGTVTSTFVGQGETLTTSGADETNKISINSLKSVGTLPSYSSINVSNKDHTHSVTYTPAGTVTSTFTGKAKSVTIDSTEDSVNVYSVKTFGSTPTSSPISVPNTLHTHTVTHTPAGTVASTFTGTSATLTTNGPSGSATVATTPTVTYSGGVLAITFNTTTVASGIHTHSVTHTPAGTVASTFTGTAATLTTAKPDTTNVSTVNSMTSAGSMPTFESVAVATGAHSHTGSYTPEGTIESTFTGTESTITVPKSSSVTSVNSMTGVGSLPASEAVSVPSLSHTHTVTHTPAGTVTSTFAGTLATLTSTKPDTTNVTTINSMTGVGSLPVQEELTVAGAGHVHNVAVTPSGDIDVTFTGNESTITVPKSASVTSVNSMTGVGSLPVFESINVSIPTHKHNVTYTPSGTIDATFTGAPSNTGSPNDALIPPTEIN